MYKIYIASNRQLKGSQSLLGRNQFFIINFCMLKYQLRNENKYIVYELRNQSTTKTMVEVYCKYANGADNRKY